MVCLLFRKQQHSSTVMNDTHNQHNKRFACVTHCRGVSGVEFFHLQEQPPPQCHPGRCLIILRLCLGNITSISGQKRFVQVLFKARDALQRASVSFLYCSTPRELLPRHHESLRLCFGGCRPHPGDLRQRSPLMGTSNSSALILCNGYTQTNFN